MRKMKGSSNYLKNQVRKNLAKAALCLLVFFLIFIAAGLQTLRTMRLDVLVEGALLFSLAPLVASYYFWRKYHIFSGGWEGEKKVVELLGSRLSDDYILLNDLYLQGGGGDIDHVVLAPGGIFVLETKNWKGVVSCNGDVWNRPGKNGFKGSPSRQANRNAATIKRIVDSSPTLRQLNIWVEGIVVFTNSHATLHLSNPTVQVIKLPQLPNHIITQGKTERYTREQLEAVGKELLRQRR